MSVIDEELFPDVLDLLQYLKQHPPVHVMLQQLLTGSQGKKAPKTQPSTRDEFLRWAQELERK